MKIQKSFKSDKATIYIVPTPIGNLEDMTIRALNILQEVNTVFCEDKRVTAKLFNQFEINTRLSNYHEHNVDSALSEMKNILDCGENIAIVSDAGMPGISDPGFEAVHMAHEEEYNVVCLPGPSAFILPIITSGFKNSNFVYRGFLNKKASKKRTELEEIINSKMTTVFYESTHKINSTLELICELNPDLQISIGRELTKLHEEYITGNAKEVKEYYANNVTKGEFVVVIEGYEAKNEDVNLVIEVEELINQGIKKKEAVKQVSNKYHVNKNELYKEFFND